MNEPCIGTNEIKCVCGRTCKGRKGLRAHQRSCKTHNTLSTLFNETSEQIDVGRNDQNPEVNQHSHSLDGGSQPADLRSSNNTSNYTILSPYRVIYCIIVIFKINNKSLNRIFYVFVLL